MTRELKTNVRSVSEKRTGSDYFTEYSNLASDWIKDWKESLQPKNTLADVLAGVTVAAIALPLNLALAVACGLPPSAGLLAGAIGGGVAAIFGGSRFQVTGPAAALNVMVLLIVKDHGVQGAAAAAIGAGLIALLLSALLAGKIVRFVPEAVLAGFTTGVGLKLLDQQIPELLGFNYHVTQLAAMMHRPTWLHEVSWLAVVCGLSVALLVISTSQHKKIPSALIGVSIVTALSIYLGWDIERVGAIPPIIPQASFPKIPDDQWFSLVMKILPLGILGAVESLLSAQVIDRMKPHEKRHNSNLELFGQGMANLASGVFGSMPVSGVVVRSSANVQSGAKSRLASLIHASILLFSVLYLSDQLARIPLAGLAGLLCVVGIRLIEVKEFIHLLKDKKIEALAFVITLVGTTTGHLVEGLIGGIVLILVQQFFTRGSVNVNAEKNELKQSGLRAVLGANDASARRAGHYEPSASFHKWIVNVRDRPLVPASSFVHEEASVIGRVVLGENVHVAADSSIRADEGSPFFIGSNSNVQDGVVLHALKDRHIKVGNEKWAIYVGKNVSMAHQALIHGPCYIGDHSFIGFKAVVHDAVIGEGCYVGIGSVVVGVTLPPGRYVPHGRIIDSQELAQALPLATHAHAEFNDDVIEVNRGLAAAYRKQNFDEKLPTKGRNFGGIQKFPAREFEYRF